MNSPTEVARGWRDAGREVAVATVVSTWGSSPRRPGSKMYVGDSGDFVGSVSGGCVETAVLDEALGVLASGEPRLLEYGVADEDAWEVGLACGGRVMVYVERVHGPGDDLDAIAAAVAHRRTALTATDLDTGERGRASVATGRDGTVIVTPETADGLWVAALRDAARTAVRDDHSGVVTIEGRRIFVDVIAPPVRVLLVGAVHIAQALVTMLRAAGVHPVVVDPRTAFATAERFPDVELVHAWPGEAFERLGLDRRTAVVTLTHDPKLDDPALAAAVRSDVFYIGALGSRRTHAKRLERLAEEGIGADLLKRIRAPVGLDISARTPGEIAASVLAEVVRELRRPPEASDARRSASDAPQSGAEAASE